LLADSLPDDFGNALINRYMADRGISPNQITPLDRLAYMSERSMGALEFKPQTGPKTKKPFAIEIGALVAEARNTIRGNLISDEHTNAALRSIIDVGTSAGGARAKAVIAWNPATNEIHSGQAKVDIGFSHWLLKFDGVGRDREFSSTKNYGRIEYAYYLMAIDAEISMSESRLLQENGRAHFMTKRFDRGEGNIKHHMQSLCAITHEKIAPERNKEQEKSIEMEH
jgi:serine/threonine-protein kinase HipA